MKKLFLAAALLILPSLCFATVPPPRSTAQEVVVVPEDVAANPCGDPFSTAIKSDLIGRVDEGKPSLVLDTYAGDELLIFQSRGYCAALDAPIDGTVVTIDSVAKGLVDDLRAQTEQYDHKITYVSKVTKVLGGNRIAVVIEPPQAKRDQAGVDFRLLTVFVFNNTRIVGLQLFTSVTGLKTP